MSFDLTSLFDTLSRSLFSEAPTIRPVILDGATERPSMVAGWSQPDRTDTFLHMGFRKGETFRWWEKPLADYFFAMVHRETQAGSASFFGSTQKCLHVSLRLGREAPGPRVVVDKHEEVPVSGGILGRRLTLREMDMTRRLPEMECCHSMFADRLWAEGDPRKSDPGWWYEAGGRAGYRGRPERAEFIAVRALGSNQLRLEVPEEGRAAKFFRSLWGRPAPSFRHITLGMPATPLRYLPTRWTKADVPHLLSRALQEVAGLKLTGASPQDRLLDWGIEVVTGKGKTPLVAVALVAGALLAAGGFAWSEGGARTGLGKEREDGTDSPGA